MSGYFNYSMSNNAVMAYQTGEKPVSKWTKTDIMVEVEKIDREKAKMLKKVKAKVLKENLLIKSSWHHTSSMYNRTDFYMVDENKIDELTSEDIERMLADVTEEKLQETLLHGDLHYIEWTGTRKHPKPNERVMEDVDVKVKGCFYIVVKNGQETFKKKIGSNGTKFIEK